MKLPRSISNLLTNKYVLYVVAFFALTNVLGYMMIGYAKCVALFIVIGFIASQFTKNMILVLLAPLIIVNFIALCKRTKEGVENMEDDKTPPTPEETITTTKTETTIPVPAATSTSTSCPTGQTLGADGKCEAFEVGRAKNGATGGAPRIDYQTTIENAYSNLDSMLGTDGIQSLTQDTKKLMDQQKGLTEAMGEMPKLMKQAQEMMKSLNGGKEGMPKGMPNLQDMMKNIKM